MGFIRKVNTKIPTLDSFPLQPTPPSQGSPGGTGLVLGILRFSWSPTAKAVLARRSVSQHAGVVSCVGG